MTPGWRRTPTVTKPMPPSAWRLRWETPASKFARCSGRFRTTSSMRALTCPRRWSRIPNIRPLRITQSYIDRLESWCDEFNEPLPALNSFVLPGGTAAVGTAACGPHRVAPGRAVGVAGGGHPRRLRQRAAGEVPQPAVGPAVHPVPGRQPRTATCCGNRADERSRNGVRQRATARAWRRPRLQPRQERRQRTAIQRHLIAPPAFRTDIPQLQDHDFVCHDVEFVAARRTP